MSVTSLEFYALLCATVALLYVARIEQRKYVLLIASAFFYLSSSFTSAAILLILIAANYGFMWVIIGSARERTSESLYFASVLFNLVVFFALKLIFEPAPNVANTGWNVLGLTIGYPLGFSFVILMLHAAVSDAYSGKYVPKRSFSTFALFSTFFPYVTAGPVERLDRMERQLDRPVRPTSEDLLAGLALISLGLTKKLVVANRMKPYFDTVFAGDLPTSVPTLVFAIILNAAYIYCDFSGYTDIARGAARCLGIRIEINFNRPFSAKSITEFWQRWHISFSTWLRDYLYMPVAFFLRRHGTWGRAFALVITFVICGFWHRAALTFVVFGFLHGAAMVIESWFPRFAPDSRFARLTLAIGGHVYALSFIAGSIVLFSAVSLAEAGEIFRRLVSEPLVPWPAEAFAYQGPFMFLLMIGAIALWQGFELWHRRLTARATPWFVLLAAWAILFGAQPDGQGFIYAQF